MDLNPKPRAMGLFIRFSRNLRQPADLWWLLRIGLFLWRAPRQLERTALPRFLEQIAREPRPPCSSITASVERVGRLQGFWLRRSFFRSRNTCYMRALTAFRFLDAAGQRLRIHFVVEPLSADGRRRGHAWISVANQPLFVPEGLRLDAVREIFVFPPPGDSASSAHPHAGNMSIHKAR